MKILQSGKAKSGNFWLYKILSNIFHYCGSTKKSFIQKQSIYKIAKNWDLSYKEQAAIDVLDIEPHQCFYRISSIFRMPIEDIDDYINQSSLVWTHSLCCPSRKDVYSKFAKIVYIVRDPRDVAVSNSRFAFTPYMRKYYPRDDPDPETFLSHRLKHIMRHWVQHVGGHLKHRDELSIHVVFYERLLRSFDTELFNLLEYLEIELNKKDISQLESKVDFMTMKSENSNHVRKGRSNEWIRVFTNKQKKQAMRIIGPMLKLLNYPVDDRQVDSFLPCMPSRLSNSQIEKAMAGTSIENLSIKIKQLYGSVFD